MFTEIGKLELFGQQAARARRYQNLIGLRVLLEARGQIGRFADQREFPAWTFSDQVADDNEAGRDADAHLELAARHGM